MVDTMPPVFVVDGARTPFLKSRNTPGPVSATELALAAAKPLLQRLPIEAAQIDEVIMGCVIPAPDEANIARILALRLGCGVHVPAWTVQRQCASGMQALDCACQAIQRGRADLVLAGGTEAMSRAPLLWQPNMVSYFSAWQAARSMGERLRLIARFRPAMLRPVIALLRGLRDPVVGLSMGVTAEILAQHFAIDRTMMDSFALRSQQRASAAGAHEEIVPLYDDTGQLWQTDDGIRSDSSMERLARLRPVFEPPWGLITAGNSSQISDGATLLMLASEKAVAAHQLPVLGRIVDCAWAGVEPELMGLGPVYASDRLLRQQNMSMQDVDYWEVNEAFAAQVQACLAAMASPAWCRQHLQRDDALGTLDEDRLNVDGGAIALGHPVGATGARLVLHALHVLHRQQQRCAIATLCIGGGQGGSMMVVRDA
jgi:acetyl-CoA C-acetyltransferase